MFSVVVYLIRGKYISQVGLVIKMAHPDSTVIHVLMSVCAKSLQSRRTLNNPMDCSLPGSFVHGILQARILEWIVMPFSRESS